MGMPRSRHAHHSRFFVNSNWNPDLDHGPFSSPGNMKSVFQRAMAFCNKRDGRSYAQALSSKCDSPLHKSDKWSASTGSSYCTNSTFGFGGQYFSRKHKFDGSKQKVSHKNSKQVSFTHSESDPAAKVCTEIKYNDCTSDRVNAQTLATSSEQLPSSDIRKLVKSPVTLNNKTVTTYINELPLSNKFEVLAENSVVESVLDAPISVSNQLPFSHDLQKSECSDDRSFTIKKPNTARNTRVQEHCHGHNSVNDNMAIEIYKNLNSGQTMRRADDVNLLGSSDNTDPVSQASHTDTMAFLPVWCTEFEKCKQQIGLRFGCVPLSPITTYLGPDIQWLKVPSIIEAHTLVKASGKPNFLGMRIPVQNSLKADKWRQYLVNYFDHQLPDLIEFGFPLSFDRSLDLTSTLHNHPSAVQFIDHVDKYIQEELSHQAIIGPFNEMPFKMHVSPFMTRDKAGSNTRRTIIDLSWPKGASVNDGVLKDSYLGTDFRMHYPSVDTIIQQVIETGPAARIFKVDISRAFRHLRIDPGDIDLLGLTHRDQLYLDLSLPFGFRLGAFFFMKISDAIRYIMQQKGYPYLQNYLDDLIYIGLPSSVDKAYQSLLSLLEELGLEISRKKLHPPDTKVVCLGILIDTIHRTMSIPTDKLAQIMQVCAEWSDKLICTKNQLQSLLGLLLYVTKCVKPARYFLNRMLQLLRDNFDKNKIKVTSEFAKDLTWFKTFLASYNGVTFYDIRPLQDQIHLDACLTGLGGAFNNMVYSIPIPKGYMDYNIAHLEMVNVVVALKIWGQCWANKRIKIHCDKAVVDILTYGRARDAIMATCARNIWLLTALYNISLSVVHIEGDNNSIADLLSRWNYSEDNIKTLHTFIPRPIWMNTHIDLMLLNHDL